MDWFEQLTGFRETEYETTRQQLELTGNQLRSRVNNRSYCVGELELTSLQQLWQRGAAADTQSPGLRFRNITADVRALHQEDSLNGAIFQVASQFNLLEMVGPNVTPEQGVTRYQHDRTQGPACAIAAGAATVYRNYFVPVAGQVGQTSTRQLDCLSDLGHALAKQLGRSVNSLWTMRNGYALCSPEGLEAIGEHLRNSSGVERDALRSLLRIGLHSNVEVTEGHNDRRPRLVSQAFCSALPVAYTGINASLWQPFAELVLEAAYEATLWAAAINAEWGCSNIVLLTQLGGGAFGNDPKWIRAAINRALKIFKHHELDVRLVSYGSVPACLRTLESIHDHVEF